MPETKIEKKKLEETIRKAVKEILLETLIEEDAFRKFELSTAGRVIRIEEKLDKFVTKEEFQKAIGELNKRIDVKTAETNKRIDEKTAETNKRIDEKIAEVNKRIDEKTAETNKRIDEKIAEVNRRIDKLLWLLVGALLGIIGTLITAIFNLLR